MRRLSVAVRVVWVLIAFLGGILAWLLLQRWRRRPIEPFQTTAPAPVITQAMRDYYQQLVRDSTSKDATVSAAAIERIAAVSQPQKGDTFQVVFARPQSMAALAYSSGNASAARALLLSNYTMVDQQIIPALNPSPQDTTAFAADPQKFTCDQLVALSNDLKAKLAAMKTGVGAVNQTKTTALAAKDENMNFQKAVTATCQGNLTPACRELASADSLLYSPLSAYESVGLTQAEQEGTLQDSIATITDIVKLLGCPATAEVQYNPDDFPFVDAEELRLKLEELSPYYLSPAALSFISNKLFDGEQVRFANTARDLGLKLDDVMGEVADINGYTIKSGAFVKV